MGISSFGDGIYKNETWEANKTIFSYFELSEGSSDKRPIVCRALSYTLGNARIEGISSVGFRAKYRAHFSYCSSFTSSFLITLNSVSR